MESKKNSSPIQINDFKVIWRIISKNWYIPLLVVPVFFLIGYFYVYKIENVYQASVELLKSNDTYHEKSLITDDDFYGSIGKSFVDNSNEIRVIKSYDLMKETIDKLKSQLEVSHFIVGRVRTTEQFFGNPFSVVVNSVNPKINELPLDFKIIDYNQYELKYMVNGVEISKKGNFNTNLIDVDFNIIVNRESGFTRNTVNQFAAFEYQIVIHNMGAW